MCSMTVVVTLELEELPLQISGRPEERAVQTFPPDGADQDILLLGAVLVADDLVDVANYIAKDSGVLACAPITGPGVC